MNPDWRALRIWCGSPPDLIRLIEQRDNERIRQWVPRLALSHLFQRGKRGFTVFHTAAEKGNADALRMLIDVFRDRLGHQLTGLDHTMAVVREINRQSEDGYTALCVAVICKSYECCLVLFGAGALPMICTVQTKVDEFSRLLSDAVLGIREEEHLSPLVFAVLNNMSILQQRPDRFCVFGVTVMEAMVDSICFHHDDAGGIRLDLVEALAEHILHLWPDMPLRYQQCVLHKTVKYPRLFRLFWRYFKTNGQLIEVLPHVAQWPHLPILLEAVLFSPVEDTILLILEEAVDPLQWYHVPTNYPNLVRLASIANVAGADCEPGCREFDDVDDENREEFVSSNGINLFRLDDAWQCPLMLAMCRNWTTAVWRMLAKVPAVWTVRWSELIQITTRAQSVAWFCRVVCHQARLGVSVRLLGCGSEHPRSGFAPLTTMDMAMTEMGNHLPARVLLHHYYRLFYSHGRAERHISINLMEVVNHWAAIDESVAAALIRKRRTLWDRRPNFAEMEFFMGYSRSRALLAAAVSCGLQPPVCLDGEGEGWSLNILLEFVKKAEWPAAAWATMAVLLRCDSRLERKTPTALSRYLPMPLRWRAVAEVRVALDAMGCVTSAQIERELKRMGVPWLLVRMCLLQDLHLLL